MGGGGRGGGYSLDDQIASFGGNRGYSYSIQGGPAPRRPPREYSDGHFETAPAVQEPPPRNPNRIALRATTHRPARPASSLYSHHPHSPTSPGASVKLASSYNHRHGMPGEISPPSSPEPDHAATRRQLAGDVSPIDDGPDMARHDSHPHPSNRPGRIVSQERPPSQTQNRGGTNIPMMRRARRKQSDAAMRDSHTRERPSSRQAQNIETQDGPDGPRWDPLTGERTNSAHGRPSQVNPAEYVQGLGITPQAASPPRNSQPTTFGERVRRIAKKAGVMESDTDPAAAAFSSSRPGWRGASGRTALVDPVKDEKNVAPLKVPDRNAKRVVSPTAALAPKSGLSNFLRRGQTPPVSPRGEPTVAPRDTVRQVVPSSQIAPTEERDHRRDDQKNTNAAPSPPPEGRTPDRAPTEITRDALASISANSPSHPLGVNQYDKSTPIRRKPAATSIRAQESVTSLQLRQSDTPPAPPAHNPYASTVPPTDAWVQPPSRFSITTYATSADGTPRESLDDFAHNHPPMPSMPSSFPETPQAPQDPVVISLKSDYKSAPHSRNPESQAARDRKAAANPAVARARTTVERPTSSAGSIHKMLPPVPPETTADEAHDRIGLLNAQLKALANRRFNIDRSIKQMTELMPTDHVLDSTEVIRKREAEKRKVEALQSELANIGKEEYELGLKLHRAYKRMDRDVDYEPTSLWVRRVTG
ncbi:hypothetical protein QBC39DRAFT_270564 [Podospora conica]|nr:hypothetical protein QBC39DRAFT_270564 [Schizothecium conicum]